MKVSSAPKVKICGITNISDAEAAIELGADLIGVILDTSVGRHGTPGLLKEIESAGGKTCAVYTSSKQVLESPLNESVSQLHYLYTDQDEEYLREHGIPIIGVSSSSMNVNMEERADHLLSTDILFMLLDYKDGAYLHLNEMKKYVSHPKFAVAGKISRDSITEVLSLEPSLIDVSSSLESSVGRKDHSKMREFFSSLTEVQNASV